MLLSGHRHSPRVPAAWCAYDLACTNDYSQTHLKRLMMRLAYQNAAHTIGEGTARASSTQLVLRSICVVSQHNQIVLLSNYFVLQTNQFVLPAISLYYEVFALYYNIIILYYKVITLYYKPISLYYRPSVCITKYLLCTTT